MDFVLGNCTTDHNKMENPLESSQEKKNTFSYCSSTSKNEVREKYMSVFFLKSLLFILFKKNSCCVLLLHRFIICYNACYKVLNKDKV